MSNEQERVSVRDVVHTPGPWRVDPCSLYILTEQNYMVAEARGWGRLQYLGHEIAEKTMKANASLIAAAPDLLEACKYAVEAIRALQVEDDGSCISPAATYLTNAIAKAVGKAV